jgi:hypothetical protein
VWVKVIESGKEKEECKLDLIGLDGIRLQCTSRELYIRSDGTGAAKYYMRDQMALQGHRIIYFSMDMVIPIIIYRQSSCTPGNHQRITGYNLLVTQCCS